MRFANLASLLYPSTFIVAAVTAAVPASRQTQTVSALREATGCAAWAHIAALEVRGTHAGDNLNGQFSETLDARNGRYAEREDDANFTSSEGYDGVAPWRRDYSATTHVLNAPSALAVAKSEAWILAHGWCDERSARYTYAGTVRTAKGRFDDLLTVCPTGGASFQLYVDGATHLVDRASIRHDENHEVTYFDDWRYVAGAALPFYLRIVDAEDRDEESRTIRTVRVLPFVAKTIFAPPPTSANVKMLAARVSVPYVVDGDKPIVSVFINGKGPFPFVVDTGGHFILTAQTAARLGLIGVGSAASTNEHTVRRVGFARVARVQIGKATITKQVAKIEPYGFEKLERGPRPPKAGWLGLEFFERFAVTFDPTDHTMTMRPLSAQRPEARGTKLPLLFDSDSPLTGCAIAHVRGICMLDTGNAGQTIVAAIWAARRGAAAALEHGLRLDGGFISRVPISIGPFERRAALAWYAPAGTPDAEVFNVEAGILSFALIDGFVTTFDYGKRGVWMQPLAYFPQPYNRSGVRGSKLPNGTFIVRAIIAGSPASVRDIKEGDVIISVNGVSASRFSSADFVAANAAQSKSITFGIRRGTTTHSETVALRDLLPTHKDNRLKR